MAHRLKGMKYCGSLIAAGALFQCASAISAQTPERLTFEVVSIKPVEVGREFTSGVEFQPGGRFIATNFTTLNLVGQAFREGEPPFPGIDNAAALPEWVRTQRYMIDARVGDPLANAKLTNTPLGAALVRSMLEDRFKLRAHLESRDVPAYALKMAKSNRALGPNIHPSPDCEALSRERVARGARHLRRPRDRQCRVSGGAVR